MALYNEAVIITVMKNKASLLPPAYGRIFLMRYLLKK